MSTKNEQELTPKQKYFCDLYLICMNAYRAAERAGYSQSVASKGTLLHLPQVQAYIKAKQAIEARRLKVDRQMILEELAKIAFATNETVTGLCKPGVPEKITLHNKMMALDKLAKHLGFYGPQEKPTIWSI